MLMSLSREMIPSHHSGVHREEQNRTASGILHRGEFTIPPSVVRIHLIPVLEKILFHYSLPYETAVQLFLFDAMGNLVLPLYSGQHSIGSHMYSLSASRLFRGEYLFEMRTEFETSLSRFSI